MNTDQLQYIGRLSFAYTKRGKKVIPKMCPFCGRSSCLLRLVLLEPSRAFIVIHPPPQFF